MFADFIKLLIFEHTSLPMLKSNVQVSKENELKSRLELSQDDESRLRVLQDLSELYTYTNIREAQKALFELNKLLQKNPNPEFLLNYHLNIAIVENLFYNFKLSDMHFKQAIQILEEEGNATQQAEAYIDYAGTLINLYENEKVIEYLEKATMYLEKAKKHINTFPNDILKARIICREGYVFWFYADYERASQSFFQSENLFLSTSSKKLKIKDLYFQTLVHAGLGMAHEKLGDMHHCVKSYRKVVDICEKSGMRSRLAWHYLNVGKAYMTLNDYDNAEDFFKKVNLISDDISQSARAYATANLGYCQFLGGRYEEAYEMYNRAEQIYKRKADDYENLARVAYWKGMLYDAIGKPKRAEKRLEEALNYADKADNPRLQALICDEIAEIYAERGDFKSAYEFEKLHNNFIKKHYEQVNQININELEYKYEAERRRKEAEMLRLQATGLQLKALRAQMNPHFIYNALNGLQNYIGANETAFAEKYLAKFSQLMRTSLDYSEMEIISLESELEFLNNYLLINQKLRFGDRMQYQVIVDEDLEEDIIGVPTMIVQPYIENAIEHGLRPKKGGMIKIVFKLWDDTTILCIIEDNGIGRENARKQQALEGYNTRHKSRGTSITEKRLEILHSSRKDKFSVKTIDLMDPLSKTPAGTRVEIRIPIVELPFKTKEEEV